MRLLATLRGALPLSLLVAFVSAQSLDIQVTKPVDCTRKTQDGDVIYMHYRGTLKSDGKEFDSSYGRGTPFEFKLGAGQVIKGWDQGLTGMCVGEGRTLTIPPGLAYGPYGSGPIPGDATLVFETELMRIEGVEEAALPTPKESSADTPKKSSEEAKTPSATPTLSPPPTPIPSSKPSQTDAKKPSQTVQAKPVDAKPTAAKISPMEQEENGECHLLGPYALLVQGALGILAVSSLAVKRMRETPRRPFKIWFFDVSKQVFGSALLHLANVLMSMLSSGKFDVATKTQATTKLAVADNDGKQPNPCSFYLLNLAIDTTIGIPILVILLKLIHRGAALTPLANPPESIRSGNYGHPPRSAWWLKQSILYFLGLFGMKFCVFLLFQLLPWIAWVGDWALRWTEGNEAIQITFVMFIFPLIMNAIQYWIIDGFIKETSDSGSGEQGRTGYGAVAGEESDEEDEAWLERRRRSGDSDDGVDRIDERAPLKEPNPTTVPARSDDFDSERHGVHGLVQGTGNAGSRKEQCRLD